MKVLVIEDDVKLARFLGKGLEAENHVVTVVHDGAQALDEALAGAYELILLDMMLPSLDGFDVLRRIRASGSSVRVIALTALGEIEQRVRGLDCGADDYMTKPFSFIELQARIRALFRRSEQPLDVELKVGQLGLDRGERQAFVGKVRVPLSARESQLLEFFLRNHDTTLTRSMIADQVWGYQFDTGTNVINVYMSYLRKKLQELGINPIRTVRGMGYRLDSTECRRSS